MPISSLETKIATSLTPNSPAEEVKVIADIVSKLESAKKPIIVVDGGGARGSWAGPVQPLITALKVPFFTTILGKGIVDENDPLYGGVYGGIGSLPEVIKLVEASDCILRLGNLPSDFNTLVFNFQYGG